MVIETKFDAGQFVWVMSKNKPEHVKIYSVCVDVKENGIKSMIIYHCSDGYDHRESEIANSKDELKDKIFK